MKRLLGIGLATALALSAFGGSALAGGTDAVNGGGWFEGGIAEPITFKMNVHAKNLPDGSAKGTLSVVEESGAWYEVEVTCLEVDGNAAIVGGYVAGSSVELDIGWVANTWIKDHGEGAGATGPDVRSYTQLTEDFGPCEGVLIYDYPFEMIRGNLQVKDR